VEAETNDADADMTEQGTDEAPSMGDIAQKAEHKQQAYESNKRLKTSLQAVSSDRGKHVAGCVHPSAFGQGRLVHSVPMSCSSYTGAVSICSHQAWNR